MRIFFLREDTDEIVNGYFDVEFRNIDEEVGAETKKGLHKLVSFIYQTGREIPNVVILKDKPIKFFYLDNTTIIASTPFVVDSVSIYAVINF